MRRGKPVGGKVVHLQDRPIIVARRKINALLDTMSEDELRLFLMLAEKYEEGRKKYGPFNLATDKRDFTEEAKAEIKDLLFYFAAAWLRFGR